MIGCVGMPSSLLVGRGQSLVLIVCLYGSIVGVISVCRVTLLRDAVFGECSGKVRGRFGEGSGNLRDWLSLGEL